VNSRLDEIQAAILRARLPLLKTWTEKRRLLAAQYRTLLAGASVTVPPQFDEGHVYHLFPVLAADREAFQAHLAGEGVGTLVHYPASLTKQPALASLALTDCPVAERVASTVVSLPLNQALAAADVEVVAAAVQRWRS
jgi:dTDP-4-amino-4,6-dideoxygalactose transaminase